MSFHTTHRSNSYSKAMTSEQFDQVVEAISEGRYSWACVLILRFAGYNPVHFIPVRTYSRLLKETRERKIRSLRDDAGNSMKRRQIDDSTNQIHRSERRICLDRELDYTEIVNRQAMPVEGGHFPIACRFPLAFLRWNTGI